MTEESKTPLEQALDLLVYAPLGLALTAREELPQLIEKGRQRLTGQLAMAKMMGQFAVAQGQKEAEKVVKQATDTLATVAGGRSSAPTTGAAGAAASAAPKPSASSSGATTTTAPSKAPTTASASGSATNGAAANQGVPPSPAAASDDDLAIPGYGALSASQVVQRLAGLSAPELEAVRAYEAATRGRKTILHRIEQLQTATAG